MLVIEIDRTNLEYDVNSIVKAFYPHEEVRVLAPDTGETKRARWQEHVSMQLHTDGMGAHLQVDETEYRWKMPDAGEPEGDTNLSAAYKEGVKSFLYKSLEAHTGKSLPWGSLTGIRPTKIAYGLLDQGKTGEEIRDFLQTKYFVSREKADLGIDIARRERRLLADLHYEGGYSLYVGIPFCPTTCLYCSFTSYPISAHRKRADAYVDALIRELECIARLNAGKTLDTVYVGGGTPTTLEPEALDRILTSLKSLFDFSTVKEFTVEAGRADSITEAKLRVLYEHGVDRISINPQTMKQETLKLIGRQHTVDQVREAYALARRIGFDNINMDIILGLPDETPEDVKNTIEEIIKLGPDSLTVHSLAIKRAAGMGAWVRENGSPRLHNTEETMDIAAQGARRLGMEPYYLYRQKNMSGNLENVGFARPGKEGIYNILIMEEVQTIMAAGAGSISKLVLPDGRIERMENVKDVTLYLDKHEEMLDRKRRLVEMEEEEGRKDGAE